METKNSDLTKIQNELNAPKNKYNAFGNFNYRSTEDIFTALKPLLLKYKCTLTIRKDIISLADKVYVKATATFTDSNSYTTSVYAHAREEFNRPKMADPQMTGSSDTYATKYALNGLFLLDDAQDPDSMDNSKKENTTKAPTANPKKALETYESKKKELLGKISKVTSLEQLNGLWADNKDFHTATDIIDAFKAKKQQILTSKK